VHDLVARARIERERVDRRDRLGDRPERRIGRKHHTVGAEEIEPAGEFPLEQTVRRAAN